MIGGEGERSENKGIHITASQPVAVYALNYAQHASTAFTCYPTPLLGTNYCVLARPSLCEYYSELGIVATATGTTRVTNTPSTNAGIYGHINAYTTNLQAGQAYQIMSNWDTNDVTGTWITSDKPIAVFAGADLAFVPDRQTEAGNPLMQEQLPVDSWGTNALSLGFAGRQNGDSYRVLAAYSNTVITITGNIITSVNESNGPPWTVTKTNETLTVGLTSSVPFDIIIDGLAQFQANQPIQVAQFANGTYFDGSEADPCEILLPPAGHYLKTNIVYTLPNDSINGDFDENFLNIIVPQSATNSTRVDGSLVAATNFVAIGTSGYYGAQLSVANSGTHKITSSQPVGVEVYGWGVTDAYGYFGGVVNDNSHV